MRIQFGKTGPFNLFNLEQLTPSIPLIGFSCHVEEYNEYLRNDALRSQKDHVVLTWLLREKQRGAIASYMSLISDAIKLSTTEKELHSLDYPFKTIPAMKIAKLAVSQHFSKKYKGIGSFMIGAAMWKALSCNERYCAVRFLTVDADIEHNEGVLAFYQKNGFIPNAELLNKNRKTVSMRKDIYQ